MEIKTERIKLTDINAAIEENLGVLITANEKAFRDQLLQLAKIVCDKKEPPVILIAGGSCAGKTTTAKLIAQILRNKGKKVTSISLDNFFKNRADTPVLPNGNKDYDSTNALLLDQIDCKFKELFKTGETRLPRYDFITGVNVPNYFHVTYDERTVVIFEGLHTINPEIYKRLHTKNVVRVYISPTCEIDFDTKVMTPQDLRFVRRSVRDAGRRRYSIVQTARQWKDVIEGEKKYITPYIKDADFIINSFYPFELGLYKLKFLGEYTLHKKELPKMEFITVIRNSVPFNKTLLPENSLMWEFIDQKDERTLY